MSAVLVWGLVAGMTATNIVMRGAPLALLSRLRLPRVVERWLEHIPVAVMAAIVAVQVLRPGGSLVPLLHNPYLPAALLTALVYRFTRSFLGATIAGVLAFLAFSYLLG